MGNRYFHHHTVAEVIEPTTLEDIGFDGEPIHSLEVELSGHEVKVESVRACWSSSRRAKAKARALLARYAHIKDGWGR